MALAEYQTDFFTIFNNTDKFSYGLSNSASMDFNRKNLHFYGNLSLTNYKNIFIPFEHFDLSTPELNFLSYAIGSELQIYRLKAGLSFFSASLLDNTISASIIDFRLKLKNVFGTDFSINLFEDYNFNFIFFTCRPEFQQTTNYAHGNLKIFYTNGIYNLQMNKVNIDFCTAFLYLYGTFDFYIPQANMILLHYIFSGNGKLNVTSFATGAKISTKNNIINFSADFGLVYLLTVSLSTNITQTSRILFFTSDKKIPYEKDISNTLLIPFSFEINISTCFNTIRTNTSFSKSFAIPILLENTSSMIQSNQISLSDKEKNSLLRMILLSGIDISLRINF